MLQIFFLLFQFLVTAGKLVTQNLGMGRCKLRRSVSRLISRACNNILIFWAFINFDLKLIPLRSKLILFYIKIENSQKMKKNTQIVTHANWANPN